MKIIASIFVLFGLCAIVEGNMLATANRLIEPIILSCGAAIFSAINYNSDDKTDMIGLFKHNVFTREKEDG